MRAGREIGKLSRKQHFDCKCSQGSTHGEIAFGSLKRLGKKMWFRPRNKCRGPEEEHAQHGAREMTGSQVMQELWL